MKYVFAGVALILLTILGLVNVAGKNSHAVTDAGNQAVSAPGFYDGPRTNIVLVESKEIVLTDKPIEIDYRDGNGLYRLQGQLGSVSDTVYVWDPDGHMKKPVMFGHDDFVDVTTNLKIHRLQFWSADGEPVQFKYQLYALR